jgi:hypothetical protein
MSKERSTINDNKVLFIAAISMLGYSILEIGDSIIVFLIAINLIPNLYLGSLFSVPIIQQLLESQILVLAPIFWAFTIMRVISTIGLFKNLQWGFWIAIISLITTMIIALLFLPVGAIELFGCSIILILLIIGYCQDNPIIKNEK